MRMVELGKIVQAFQTTKHCNLAISGKKYWWKIDFRKRMKKQEKMRQQGIANGDVWKWGGKLNWNIKIARKMPSRMLLLKTPTFL